jgi:hypothetical protein
MDPYSKGHGHVSSSLPGGHGLLGIFCPENGPGISPACPNPYTPGFFGYGLLLSHLRKSIIILYLYEGETVPKLTGFGTSSGK